MNDGKEFMLSYAKQHYAPPFYTEKEFASDYHKFLVLKKMFSRYQTNGHINVPLILNIFITLNNVFDTKALNVLLFTNLKRDHWVFVKTFLMFLSIYQQSAETMAVGFDESIAAELGNIRWRGRVKTA